MATPDDDALDGCDLDLSGDVLSDDDVLGHVLFAGVPADQVAEHAAALRALGE